jgi:hypothetical protein
LALKNPQVESASEQLLSLLLKKTNKLKNDDASRIDTLVQCLEKSNSHFDPDVVFNGPLYAVLYQSGPRPFWEKLDLGLSLGANNRRNIKGQRYTKLSDGVYEVKNYAEFFGPQFRVEANGICKRNTNSNAKDSVEFKMPGIFDTFTKLFDLKLKTTSSLVQCPADYNIEATGVSIRILENTFNIDVRGQGYMRVLYADNNLRNLTVREDTRSTANTVDEKAGLTVVQVRVDLIDPTFDVP